MTAIPRPRIVTWSLLVLTHLLPVLAVVQGWMTLDEAIAVFFLEICLAAPVTVVKLCTSSNGPDDGMPLTIYLVLFGVLYGGIAVTTSVYVVVLIGLTPMTWALAAFLVASDGLALVWHWFVRGERHAVSRGWVFAQPMLRFLAVLVVLGWFSSSSELVVFTLMVLVKAVFEVAMDLWAGWTVAPPRRRSVAARPLP